MSEAEPQTDKTTEPRPSPVEPTTSPAWYMALGSWYTAPTTAGASQPSAARG